MIIEIIHKALAEEAKRELNRVGSGKWKPSSFGHCYRSQVYDKMGVKKETVTEPIAMLKMKLGSAIHSVIQKIVSANTSCLVEYCIENDDVTAFVDLLLPECVVEIKTTDCEKFKKIAKYTEEDLVEHKKENVLQAVCYAIDTGRKKVVLLYINTCTMEMKEFELDAEKYRDLVVNELDMLNSNFEKDKLPLKMCRLYHGYEYRYCGHQKRCAEDEQKKGAF